MKLPNPFPKQDIRWLNLPYLIMAMGLLFCALVLSIFWLWAINELPTYIF